MRLILHNIASYVAGFIGSIASGTSWLLKKWFNRKEFFTLMIIPHAPVKNVKSVKFSKWLVSSFVILNVIMFTVVCIFGFSYYTLNMNLESKKAEYESLQVMKEHDEKQLQEYKASEKEIKEKIHVLKDLEGKLKEIIESKGTKPQSSSEGLPKLASRGSGGSLSPNRQGSAAEITDSEIDDLDNYKDINITIDQMISQVNQRVDELNVAIEKAEQQIKIMRAKPSALPTYGTITSVFGYRRNPFGYGYEFHDGIDIANDYGTPIVASGDGVVTVAERDGGYGILVRINHQNGYESLYGHNSRVVVKEGQTVKRGQVIAYMGSTGRSTGTHCHFEVRLYGKPINPYNVK